ncbi:MAG: hypothetical protein HYU36_00645 [Planctomycetes bacterium]|nr:hypothetical protein [Planctomycetota bacterium]
METPVGIPVHPDGRWAIDYLAGLTAEQWEVWVENRLRGRDRVVGYRPEEYPEGASHIFKQILDMAQDDERSKLPERLAEGVSRFFQRLKPEGKPKEDYWVLYHAIDLVGYCRGQSEASRLKEWIEGEVFLKPTKWKPDGIRRSVALHQAALSSLALLQRRGDVTYRKFFEDRLCIFSRPGYKEHQYDFIATAFIGLSLASESIPIDELKKLLELEKQAEKKGISLYISHAVLSLFEGEPVRPAFFVRQQLAEAGNFTNDEWEALVAHTAGSGHPIPRRETETPSGSMTVTGSASVWTGAPALVETTTQQPQEAAV